MAAPPIGYHSGGDLAGIANRSRFGLDDFVAPLARAAMGVSGHVRTHASVGVMSLGFLKDLVLDAVIRKLLQSPWSDSGQIGVVQRGLGSRWIG
jgi:hypothetical protein